MSIYQDYKDDNFVNGSIGGWSYAGSIIGGAISGAGQGFVGTIILGGLGSIVNNVMGSGFNPDWENMIFDCLTSVGVSAIGYGIGQIVRFGFSGVEAKALKALSKSTGNNVLNKYLNRIGAGVNIGVKDVNKLANALFNAEKNMVGAFVESLASSIPGLIKDLI